MPVPAGYLPRRVAFFFKNYVTKCAFDRLLCMDKLKEIAAKMGEVLQSEAWHEQEVGRLSKLSQLTEHLEWAILELEPGGGLPRAVRKITPAEDSVIDKLANLAVENKNEQ